MNITIQNQFLTVTVSRKGAELQSILGADGTEYLWQGDPAYWPDRALNIFPYVARLTEGTYQLDGQLHHMAIHGIAPYRVFTPVSQEPDRLVLELRSDGETRLEYPREFSFRIVYALEGSTLNITYEVENRDEKTMYFGLGGHPGFRVPRNGGSFESYRLRFGEACEPVRVGFTEKCFLSGEDASYPLVDGTIPLRHDLFDEDAIVLKNMAHSVTLECPGDSHSVTVSYPQMDYLGIWHMPKTDAPYVCIEPWCSLPSTQDKIAVFEEQPDLISLAPGKTYQNNWRIQIT